MQGIYFLLSLIGFGVIVFWYVQNDGLAPGEPTKGLLRMRDAPPAEADEKEKDRRGRSAGARR
jgi:hypothetical protein